MPEDPKPEPAPSKPAPTPEPVPPAEPTIGELQAEVEKWKKLSRKNEDRAKENAEKAAQYDDVLTRAETAEKALVDKDAELHTARIDAYQLSDEDKAILAMLPPDKVDDIAKQLAARTPDQPAPDFVLEHLGKVGDPIPPKAPVEPTANDLIRAAANK